MSQYLVGQMANSEPLLQTNREQTPRPKVLSLAFFRQWTKGQPLRETESLDYEPLYNKVYFARRKQPSRRFYGYARCHSTKYKTCRCVHAEPASSLLVAAIHKSCYQCFNHTATMAPISTLRVQVHRPYLGQVFCDLGNRTCDGTNSCGLCCYIRVCLSPKATGCAVDDQHCQAQGSTCWLWSPFADHNKLADVCCLYGEFVRNPHLACHCQQ